MKRKLLWYVSPALIIIAILLFYNQDSPQLIEDKLIETESYRDKNNGLYRIFYPVNGKWINGKVFRKEHYYGIFYRKGNVHYMGNFDYYIVSTQDGYLVFIGDSIPLNKHVSILAKKAKISDINLKETYAVDSLIVY